MNTYNPLHEKIREKAELIPDPVERKFFNDRVEGLITNASGCGWPAIVAEKKLKTIESKSVDEIIRQIRIELKKGGDK